MATSEVTRRPWGAGARLPRRRHGCPTSWRVGWPVTAGQWTRARLCAPCATDSGSPTAPMARMWLESDPVSSHLIPSHPVSCSLLPSAPVCSRMIPSDPVSSCPIPSLTCIFDEALQLESSNLSDSQPANQVADQPTSQATIQFRHVMFMHVCLRSCYQGALLG